MHSFRFDGLAAAEPGTVIVLEKSESAHLFKTLRAAEGDLCRLLDGRGNVGSARVSSGRTLVLLERSLVPPLSGVRLHLYLAPPRRQKTDQILKQCAELGVRSVTPLVCERSVALPDSGSVGGRWNELLFEACKQSGNPYLPVLSAPLSFSDGVGDAARRCRHVFFGSVRGTADGAGNGAGTGERSENADDLAWFVGPEGGFSSAEEETMLASGFLPLHLETWILRAETAAVCGLAVLRDRFSVKK